MANILAKMPWTEAIFMNLSKKYRKKRHSVSLLHAHLVFCIKYRRKVITRRAFEHLRRSMRSTAQTLDVEIIAVESDGDHLHLMICYPPKLHLSKIVQRLKGASSRHIRTNQKLWGKAFWSPSYFVVSCGGAPLDKVKDYVENQTDPLRKKRIRTKVSLKRKSSKPYPRTEVRGLRANL